jgi:iron complex outermembrane recepter protein
MMMETLIARSVRLVCASGMLVGMHAALAQTAQEAPMQRVEITGSSIKRIAAEAALPVQSFSQKDIARTGVTSVTDFIQQLPVMQGFTVAADSVGGSGGGITTASIHDVGESYTLVLINGRRMAPATSGTTIDVNSIPLSAVDRIEVLTDGASALYGADAIAGVVNFILKKGAAPLTLEAKYGKPQHPGARSKTASISKGFGELDTDGYTVFLSASHQTETRMKASQRDFARTGIIDFKDPKSGQMLTFFNGSSRSIPPNVDIYPTDPDGEVISLNPYLKLKGQCPPAHVIGGEQCVFDYTSSVEISPELKRDGIYASGELKLGNSGFKAFADVALNRAHVYATIAPYPAEFALAKDSPLFLQYLRPYLTDQQYADTDVAVVKYRLQDLGGRAYDYESKTTHIVTGLDGNALGWDMNAAFTYSKNKSPQHYVGGFPLADKFDAALGSGAVDPFPYALGEMPAEMIKALQATQFVGVYNTTTIDMKNVDLRASREVFKLPAGTAQLGVGADFRRTSYAELANQAVAHSEILFDSDQPEFAFRRRSAGAYAELLTPIAKGLDVTTSLRYDQVGKITDGLSHAVIGSKQSASTYKVSARYQPARELLFRAAYGTGFKVASMKQIGQPLSDFGVTGGTYPCPITPANGLGSHPLAQYCVNVPAQQIEVFQGGNPDLRPEKSKQWSFGGVWEPAGGLSVKLDYWSVDIKDAVDSVSEKQIAENPAKYIALYTTKFKDSTGRSVLAMIDAPVNIGSRQNQGIDYDLLYKGRYDDVRLTTRLAGTRMLKSRHKDPGTENWLTSLGEYGADDKVSFRDVIKASVTADAGRFTHNLGLNYRSSYKDIHYTVASEAVNDADGNYVDVQLDVKAYATFDWQSQFRLNKAVELTAGIQNLGDKKPPLSLRAAGSHQLGYDPRYASAVGRTFYLSASYKFD